MRLGQEDLPTKRNVACVGYVCISWSFYLGMILREKVSEHYLELKGYTTALGSGMVCLDLTNALLNELITVTKRELGDDGTA
jgi:hypothetical protein